MVIEVGRLWRCLVLLEVTSMSSVLLSCCHTVRDVLDSITERRIPDKFLVNFVIMLCIWIYTFLLVLGMLNYYTTRDSLSVYLRCDSAGFHISNSITWNIKNSTDLRVSSFHVFLESRPMQHGMPFKNLNCRSTPYQVNLVVVMLLLSGDVQLNPGPPTRTPKYICGVCSKNVNSSHKAMECEDCLTWYHINCVNMGDNIQARLCSIKLSTHFTRYKIA